MANLPTSVPSFTTKNSGDVIQPSHINSLQDEIAAAGDMLLNGWSATNWQAFTPSWTNVTVGNGTATGKYFIFGDLVVFRVDLAFGSTTTLAVGARVNFPVTAETGASFCVGLGTAIDASASARFGIRLELASGTALAFFADNGTSLVDVAATVPFTWTTSDELHILGVYEAA